MTARTLLTAGGAALALGLSLLASPAAFAAPAASSSCPHVVTVDASGSQLVFTKKTTDARTWSRRGVFAAAALVVSYIALSVVNAAYFGG